MKEKKLTVEENGQELSSLMMSEETIQEQVYEIMEDLCLTSVQDEHQTLLGDLALDSLRMVMLLVMLEDTFEIDLDESDMNPFALITVYDVIALVKKYVTKVQAVDENG